MTEWKDEITKRLSGLKLEATREAEIAEELAQHLEDRYQELLASGIPEEEARETALQEIADTNSLAEELRRVEHPVAHEPVVLGAGSRKNFLADLWQDLRYGLRQLRHNPGFTAVAVITLALGIGANTAIFSVVYAVVLRPLPFPHPEQLMAVWSTREGTDDVVTPRNFDAWRHESRSFSRITANERAGFNLTEGDHTIRVSGALASADFFAVFGVAPLLGRTFTAEEDRPGGPNLVVLSDRLWREQFGADRRILGREINLNRVGYAVIGVMPPAFDLRADAPQLWAPLRLNGQMMSWMGGVLDVAGRLRPGMSLRRAQAEMNVLARSLEARYPQMNHGRGIRVVSLSQDMIGDYRERLFILVGAVGLVLFIACANVANLLLARGMGRTKELAIRAALGASAIRTLRQLLTETLLLALGAAAVGVAFGYEGIRSVTLVGPPNLPRMRDASINGPVLAFVLMLALLSTVLCGVAPALRVIRVDLVAALQQGGRSGVSFTGNTLRRLYIAAEVAMAMLLLTAAGLLVRTAVMALRIEPGFAADHLLTARTALPRSAYPSAIQVSRAYGRILDELKTSPGVVAAALSSKAPLTSSGAGLDLKPGAVAVPMKTDVATELRYISPGYFTVIQTSLLRGRGFTVRDREGSQQVAIVNKMLAQRLWPGRDPVGQWIRIPEIDTGNPVWEVVGLVADTRDNGLMADAPAVLYVPYTQVSTNAWHWTEQSLFLVVRTRPQPQALVASLEHAVQVVDPSLPLSDIHSMRQRVEQSTAVARLYADLLAILGACGLFLACMGIYGVAAYFVSCRRAEIGLRIALGATPQKLLLWVVGQGMRPVVGGIGLGLVASLATARVLASQLYGVSDTDPLTLAVVTILFAGVACIACYIPARRATKVDPMVALRNE